LTTMPEVLGEPPSPRTALFWNGTAWQWALVDAAGHLQIDTVTSALPAGAATAAAQALALAQLQLIEDMRDALQSVATDRLIVRGEDQLFTYKAELFNRSADTSVAAGDHTQSTVAVPADEIWVVTHIAAWCSTSVITRIEMFKNNVLEWYQIGAVVTPVQHVGLLWDGHIYLDPTDQLHIQFVGCALNDSIYSMVLGYTMTLET